MIEKLNYPQIGLLVLSWFAADLLSPIIIRISHSIGAVDKPHSYKIHKEPISFLGGLTIYIAFSIAIFSILRFESFDANRTLFAIIFGGFFVVVIGMIDDFKPTSAVIKLIILLASTYLLSHFGIKITIFGNDTLDMILTMLWIAGVTSAMNSLDNMDGASTGVAAIASFFTFIVAWYSTPPQKGLSYVSIAMFGSCLGLLRYNFKPARIFLGDNGSLLLGFLLATITTLAGWSKEDPIKAIVIPCSILAVPLYDITLSTILRYKNKVVSNFIGAITYCGRDHLSHRLVALGLSEREAVLMLYLFGTVSGATAILFANDAITPKTYIPVTLLAIMVLVVTGAILDKAKVYDKKEEPKTDKNAQA
ncbi:MAG: hypothetical protein A2W23_10285 [Planctomycetes bacterium RBG_16_43_13]|nr:MAG: hypothetical protein A2W23_10285 [Planctomycetes bacterium RBG_16_43_13]